MSLRDELTRVYDNYTLGRNYRPGGRSWQFTHPRALNVTLSLIPVSRVRQWVYLHWPKVDREPGTIW